MSVKIFFDGLSKITSWNLEAAVPPKLTRHQSAVGVVGVENTESGLQVQKVLAPERVTLFMTCMRSRVQT